MCEDTFSSWNMMSSCRNLVALSWTLECCLSLEHVFLFMSKLVLKESRSPCCFQNKIKRMFFSEDSQKRGSMKGCGLFVFIFKPNMV